MSDDRPLRTAVLVLNYNGVRHLDDCLSSLGELDVFATGGPGRVRDDGPRDEVWLIDNASHDDSLTLVRERYPWVRIAVNETNLGFPRAYNRVVEACPAEQVAFLNNDTRVRPDWLSALHATRQRRDAAAVASRILSWDGHEVDFIGADTYFFGHALQHQVGAPAVAPPPERELLFGCAGSLLFDRSIFLEVGGFDPDYFSFSEDVDLGWRAQILGYRTWFAPDAVTHHRLHASWGPSLTPRSRFLLERNALANVVKNWGDERMGVVLLVSAALTFLRGWWAGLAKPVSEAPRALFTDSLCHFLALVELLERRASLAARRARVQAGRRRQDDDLLPLLGALANPPLPAIPSYRESFRRACALLAAGDGRIGRWPAELTQAAERAAWRLAEVCAVHVGPAFDRIFIEGQVDLAARHPIPPPLADVLWHTRRALESFLAGEPSAGAIAALDAQLASCLPSPRSHVVPVADDGLLRVPISVVDSPAAAIVVRTVDRPDVLPRALESIAAQTRRPEEVILVVDGGPDPSPIVARFAGALRVRVERSERPRGRSGAAQAGLCATRAPLVGFLDDDDTLHPHHLEVLSRSLAERRSAAAFADVECVVEDPGGAVVSRSFFNSGFDPVRLLFENTIPIMAMLMERQVALEVGGFDESLDYFEDWDLWIRLSRHTHVVHCPVVTATYHVRPHAGHGVATTGEHRYAHMRALFAKHRESVQPDDWIAFYRTYVEGAREATRQAEIVLRRQHAAVAELQASLAALHSSRAFRLLLKLRRFLALG